MAIHGIGDHAQFATTREIADYKGEHLEDTYQCLRLAGRRTAPAAVESPSDPTGTSAPGQPLKSQVDLGPLFSGNFQSDRLEQANL